MKNNLLCDGQPAGDETNLERNVKNGGERSKDGGGSLIVARYSLIVSVPRNSCERHPEYRHRRDEGSDHGTSGRYSLVVVRYWLWRNPGCRIERGMTAWDVSSWETLSND
jgi:hypothetical protein